jgi:hypothetical protein
VTNSDKPEEGTAKPRRPRAYPDVKRYDSRAALEAGKGERINTEDLPSIPPTGPTRQDVIDRRRAIQEIMHGASDPPAVTGMQGRPSSKHLLEAELRRRWAKASAEDKAKSKAHWVRLLLEWLKTAHPNEPQPKQETAENSLRDTLRELQSQTP